VSLALELLRTVQRQGYSALSVGALIRPDISEQAILDAAGRLGFTIQTRAGAHWVRLS